MSTQPVLEMSLEPRDIYKTLLERIDSNLFVFLASASVSFGVGFLQYIFAIWLPLKGGRSAMPFWMHSFYLANDSIFCYVLGAAASRFGNHWFLRGTSIALAVWSALEIYCIWRALTKDRRAVFSDLIGQDPPLCSVLWYALAQQAAWYAIIVIAISLLGEGCFMHCFSLTNVAIAVGPLHEYIRRRSREGLSLSLCAINVLGTALTFSPFSMWAIALPEVFAGPAYQAAGAVLTLYCIGCFAVVRHYFKPSNLQPSLCGESPRECDKVEKRESEPPPTAG